MRELDDDAKKIDSGSARAHVCAGSCDVTSAAMRHRAVPRLSTRWRGWDIHDRGQG